MKNSTILILVFSLLYTNVQNLWKYACGVKIFTLLQEIPEKRIDWVWYHHGKSFCHFPYISDERSLLFSKTQIHLDTSVFIQMKSEKSHSCKRILNLKGRFPYTFLKFLDPSAGICEFWLALSKRKDAQAAIKSTALLYVSK